MAQTVKNPSTVSETWVRSLGWEDPLEKGMAARSRILAWRIPWTVKLSGLQSMGHQELDTTEGLNTSHIHVRHHRFSQPKVVILGGS